MSNQIKMRDNDQKIIKVYGDTPKATLKSFIIEYIEMYQTTQEEYAKEIATYINELFKLNGDNNGKR